MKRILGRVRKFISIFYPRNIYKIFIKLYAMTNDHSGTRTEAIINLINDKKYRSYLEVGVWKGDNLFPIAKKFPDLICYGVDPYSVSSFEEYFKGDVMSLVHGDYYERLFQEISIKARQFSNITVIRKTSEEAAKDYEDASLDVVFIDARHDYESVVKDIKLWLSKVKVGGYFVDMTML